MDDKNLLTEDTSDKPETAPTLAATSKETDSKLNNEAALTSDISSDEKKSTQTEAKPKRKYTRKAAPKTDSAAQVKNQSEPKNDGEAAKPKRTYTKKFAATNADSQNDVTEGVAKTTSNKTSTTRKKASTQKKLAEEAETNTKAPDSPGTVFDATPVAIEDEKKSDVSTDAVQSTETAEDTPTLDLFTTEEFKFIPDLSSSVFEDDLKDEPDAEIFSDNEDGGEDDRILPPDELFADRRLDSEAPAKADAPSENTDEEELPDAPMDEDGQYRFAELEETDDEPILPPQKEQPPEKYDPQKPRRVDGRFDIVELFVFTLLAVMIITSFFFRHSIVEGESMENTLHSGEHLIISDLFYTPQRGDIIVCEDYSTKIPKPIVKRVIAVAGDTVEIKADGSVYVNYELLEENYVNIDIADYKYTPMPPVKIPEGELFVMGDHRNKSTDSREIGTVSEDSVLGKVLIRFYPFDKFGTVK